MIIPFFAVTRMLFQNKYRPNSVTRNNQLRLFIRKEPLNHFSHGSFTDLYLKVHHHFSSTLPPGKSKSVLNKWNYHLSRLFKLLKSNPVEVARTCMEHIEFVLAQRIRRGQQMITLYTKLWDEGALKHFFQKMKRALNRKGKFIIGGSVMAFDWETERIPTDELERLVDEVKRCQLLRQQVNQGKTENCLPLKPGCPDSDLSCNEQCWIPFIQEEDLTLWKMEEIHHPGSGLYCYKIYSKYSDVTANDFLEVFLDTENRTKWDVHAASLEVIDSEPQSNSDVIYWETKWPTFFSNRDYVFKRRYHKLKENKVIIIMNKSTEHPMYPPTNSKARVTEYWSYMVIQASSDFDKPGIEFSLTYFDNPGVSLPSALSLWITVQGVPEYLKNLRKEALAINEKRRSQGGELGKTVKRTEGPSGPTDSYAPHNDWDILSLFASHMEKIKTSIWL